jgi:hypothetical protein
MIGAAAGAGIAEAPTSMAGSASCALPGAAKARARAQTDTPVKRLVRRIVNSSSDAVEALVTSIDALTLARKGDRATDCFLFCLIWRCRLATASRRRGV